MGMPQAHISALELKHADIEARIVEESQRPLPDLATLSRLKKEKLKVKEAIAGLHCAALPSPGTGRRTMRSMAEGSLRHEGPLPQFYSRCLERSTASTTS